MAKLPEGVFVRHQRDCRARTGGRCGCRPTYQAQVYDRVTGRRKSRSFPSAAAARTWRQDAMLALRRGSFRPGRPVAVRQAAGEWIEGARAGLIHTRSGELYKPSALRGYDDALRLRIAPAIGPVLLSDLRRSDIQRLVGRWLAEGLSASTIRNTLMPLRAIYRRALALDEVAVNPTLGLQLPAVRGRRERFASAEEAAELIDTAPPADRALWATAMYAGLRRGELQALDVSEVDLAAVVIRVRHGWDRKAGRIATKSGAGRRSVPIAAALRDELLEHKLRLGRERGLIFGRTPEIPFTPDVPYRRAKRAWEAASLAPIGLHECRHTFASLMIAAGVNPKALSAFMGHSSVTITLDRYGHLMPGSEEEAAVLLDDYLDRANTRARKAAIAS
jgi:integrase